MTAGLMGVQSSSFLISCTKHTSSIPFPLLADHTSQTLMVLPLPNWDVIQTPHDAPHQTKGQLQQQIDSLTTELQTTREVINYRERQEEANSAMLVVKDLTLQKLNESLHCKENKKTKRNKVFAGRKG